MEIKPIRTEADYQAALEEIENLFDARPDTREGDRLEVLTILVEAYEEKHYGIPLPDPIEAILYFMESRLPLDAGGRSRLCEASFWAAQEIIID